MAESSSQHFKLDASRFIRGLTAAIPTSRKDASALLLMQGRGLMKTVIAITPPGSSHKENSNDAKWRGELMVESDMRKVVAPTRRKSAKPIDIAAAINARRNKRTGRVRKSKQEPIYVPTADFSRELKRRKGLVGTLAAGWKEAARFVGYNRVPAWIMRHSTPGHAKLTVTGQEITLTVTNASRFASDIKGMQRRVQWALNLQGKRMVDAADHYWAKKFRQAGFQVTA